MILFKLFWIAAAVFHTGSCLSSKYYVVNNFAPERCSDSASIKHNEYVIGVNGDRDVVQYKVVDDKITRSFGDSCCPSNTQHFDTAIQSNESWTYYVYDWTKKVSEVEYTNVSWSFIDNILEKETWKRHEKLKLDYKMKYFTMKPGVSNMKIGRAVDRYYNVISDSVSYEQYKWFTYDVIGDLWYFTIPDYKDNYYFENIINGGWSEWYQINECKADDGAVNFFRACTKPPPMNNGTLCDGGDGFAEKFQASCSELNHIKETKFKNKKLITPPYYPWYSPNHRRHRKENQD